MSEDFGCIIFSEHVGIVFIWHQTSDYIVVFFPRNSLPKFFFYFCCYRIVFITWHAKAQQIWYISSIFRLYWFNLFESHRMTSFDQNDACNCVIQNIIPLLSFECWFGIMNSKQSFQFNFLSLFDVAINRQEPNTWSNIIEFFVRFISFFCLVVCRKKYVVNFALKTNIYIYT